MSGLTCESGLILKRCSLKTGEIPVFYSQYHATPEGHDFGQRTFYLIGPLIAIAGCGLAAVLQDRGLAVAGGNQVAIAFHGVGAYR